MTLETVTISAAGQSVTLTAEQFARAPEFIAGRTVDSATGEIMDTATRVANDAPKPKRGQLPDEFLNKLRQWRGHNDPTYWGLGDDVADAIVEMAGQFTQQKIFKAAAVETEYSIAEVRLLWETARAFDKQMRDEFGDVLTHQHFRVLRYVDDRAKQEGYLRWCLESADMYNGRPAPAAILAKKVRRELGHEPPPPTFGELYERAVRAVENLRDNADTEVRHQKVEAVLALLQKVN